MKCKINIIPALACLFVGCATTQYQQPDITSTASPKGVDVFEANPASIEASYTIPEWFTDDKFGIFIHWGLYSVPAYGDGWYGRNMYDPKSKTYKFHVENFGKVDEFGYKEFIPMFKAEKFNAKEWAKIFKESGAKYVVPVAEHHDGFSMYNSTYNPWNSVDMGPKRDIIAELSKAIKDEGLVFGLSSHRAELAWFFNFGLEIPSDVQNSTLSIYGERLPTIGGKAMSPDYGDNEGSNDKSRREWLIHMYELVDQYKPDLIWFDWTVGKYPFQSTFYKFLAYYYNSALEWDKEVIVNTKTGFDDKIQVFDIERGKSDKIRRYAWQTDTSIGKRSWSYFPEEENKTPDHIIDDFIDIVSKNGNLLLNIGPKADGTITEEQADVLRKMGEWLKINGEAIYKSRPWVRAGEGKEGSAGYMTDGLATPYEINDLRFTTNDGYLYAISLGTKSKSDKLLIRSLSPENIESLKVESVSLVGSDEVIKFKQTLNGLEITLPKKFPSEYANVFKIKYEGIAFGKVQTEQIQQQNDVLIDTYISNETDKPYKADIELSVGKYNFTKTVYIKPHSKEYIGFDTLILPNGKYEIKMTINGKYKSSKKVVVPYSPPKKEFG